MIRTVGKIKDGEEILVIFDDGLAPVWADIVTEISAEDGVIRMSFAAITQDGDGIRKADVVARVRMLESVAWALCRALKELEG